MTDNYTEMIHVLEDVVKVNRAATLSHLRDKTGLDIVSGGDDHGMIVTDADKKVSQYLLDGGIEGIEGLREKYPGSFSEEDDSNERVNSNEIIQVDPLDGTGDMVDTYQSSRVIGPTTLVSKLQRESTLEDFKPVSGLIFDVLNEYALISDGSEIGLLAAREDGGVREIPYERTEHPWNSNEPIRINRRVSYPQLVFDGPFMDYLKANDRNIERVEIGGAGTFAMQFFRNYIQPRQEVKGFSDLNPITIGFNAQPDWKTWDTDPTEVIANALSLPERTNIYGDLLSANAASDTLEHMHHTKGYVLSPTDELRDQLTAYATEFRLRNQDCPLTKKDYDYKDSIIDLTK